MKKTTKLLTHFFATMILMLLCVPLLPARPVSAATALQENDFTGTYDGKSWSFFEDDFDYSYHTFAFFEKTSRPKKFVTKRNVKIGSKASYVTQKYGTTQKHPFDPKDRVGETFRYEYPQLDIANWKTYLEYSYEKNLCPYYIRFYLDSKNKVVSIIYMQNPDYFLTDYPNKEVKSGLTFQAPAGKRIKTKTINHKKVYLVPKGSTFKFVKSKSNATYPIHTMNRWDKNTLCTAHLPATSYKYGKKYKLTTELKKMSLWKNGGGVYVKGIVKHLNPNNLGNYMYFTFTTIDGDERAPQHIFFKIV